LLTDPPVLSSQLDGYAKRLFRKAYISLIGLLIRNFDGMIALSPAFKELFNFEGQFIFIEGV
tara:strand:- start:621 stop:806 length:186 start_codon:yes stop_codon:yes gene_type:complete